MSNPYSAPNAPMSGAMPNEESYEPQIFAVNGRIGRLRYLAYAMLYSVLGYIAIMVAALLFGLGTAVAGAAGVGAGVSIGLIIGIFVLAILYIVPFVILMRRRLNDLDKSGWFILLTLIPIVGFFFALYMVFWPGTSTTNRWGPKPIKNSVGVIIAACIFPVMFIGIIAAVAIPAYQDYVNRAKMAQMESSSAYEDESYNEESYGEESYNEEGYTEEAGGEESYQDQGTEDTYQDDSYQEEAAEEESYSEESSGENTENGEGQ